MEVARHCTCSRQHPGSIRCVCSQSSTTRTSSSPSIPPATSDDRRSGLSYSIPKLFLGLLCAALTCLFALAGALAGAVAGAFAGRASDSGVLRGAGLGALAGAVLSVEILQASRIYWCAGGSDSQSSPSMAAFIEELFYGRLVRDHLIPTAFTDNHWQVSISNVSYDEMYGVYQQVASRGLPIQSLRKLPSIVITNQNKSGFDVGTCCTICLQDIEVGETVRQLLRCHHLFHLTCVDKWLVRHGSCPVCRQRVLML